MKIRTLVTALWAIALAATLATAAQAGGTARKPLAGRPLTHKPSAGSHTAATARVRTSSPDTVYRAPWPATPIVTPIYVYQPSGAVSPGTVSEAEACAVFGSGCSDEQLCAVWAINCAASGVSSDPLSQADECAAFATGCSAAQVCAIWALDCPAGPQPVDATAEGPGASGK
jgi:hypothetical protein